jgi:hypothetical protein
VELGRVIAFEETPHFTAAKGSLLVERHTLRSPDADNAGLQIRIGPGEVQHDRLRRWISSFQATLSTYPQLVKLAAGIVTPAVETIPSLLQ